MSASAFAPATTPWAEAPSGEWLQLARQVAHWTMAAERLVNLHEQASATAWEALERYLGLVLRQKLLEAVNQLRQDATALRSLWYAARTEGQFRQLRQRVTRLRQQYLRTETLLDFYSDAINTRTNPDIAAILRACDVLSRQSMTQLLQPLGKATPPVLTYLDKGLGASILKAGLRLWDGNTQSQVAAIKIVRHNLYRPTALIHEAGHQVAHILGWNQELATALATGLASSSPRWRRCGRGWASEVAADGFAFVHTGYAAVANLHDVVDAGGPMVFRYRPGDPHPTSYIRVLLGTAMCQRFFGDGQVDLVELDPPMAGFYERTDDHDWASFRPFTSLPNLAWNEPNLKFVDLTGDGHADVLITEDWALTWYPSLAEDGFGPANRVRVPTDEERGPRVVFADGTQTIFLADLSGDGLSDIARIRNGEVCYWPNLGYGRFGAKVTMDDAPWFDAPDQFDPRRIRLADIDGTGTTDLIYLGRNQTRLWFNQCGNAWSPAHESSGLPPVDNLASVAAVDLLGNGTACLVWSSPLPADSRAPMKYLKLIAEGKPHLLVGARNNLGAETRVHYAPSTYFYLRDKEEGRPWITKLPFTVHVVERVETLDHISRNRFVTRYAYHHGYFDGEEREFRGFGMVEP
jgi:hypothetical protein